VGVPSRQLVHRKRLGPLAPDFRIRKSSVTLIRRRCIDVNFGHTRQGLSETSDAWIKRHRRFFGF